MHLRLRRAIKEGARKPSSGFPRDTQHPKYGAHASRLRETTNQVRTAQLSKPQVLGIDPKLVVVFELNRPVDWEEFRHAGLVVLDGSQEKVVVAFSSDPELGAFFERLDAYGSGPREGAKRTQYLGFFDAIENSRSLQPLEKLTKRLQVNLSAVDTEAELRLDIECWHPGEAEGQLALQWLRELAEGVKAADGKVADTYVNSTVGLSVARVYLKAKDVLTIAALDQVARIDELPLPLISVGQLYRTSVGALPRMSAPLPNSPIVGLIDSGVRSAHPLIGPALEAIESLSGEFADGEDESGHGTRIAGLILHGQMDKAISLGLDLRPYARLISVRVLDKNNHFPSDSIWEKDLEEAIRYCAGQGATIINLSIGDSGTIYQAPRATPVAALLDQLAKELELLLVISAGNVGISQYSEIGTTLVDQYPKELATSTNANLLDPAPAALALTVGSLVAAATTGALSSREDVGAQVLGTTGWPSPFSRHGPGIAGAIKPELSAPGGSRALHPSLGIVDDPELGIVSLGGGSASNRERLLEWGVGTSYAAPFVTRIASAVLAQNPSISPNLLRALLLQSAAEPSFAAALLDGKPGEQRRMLLDLVGFGTPAQADAIASRDHRAVLVAEGPISVNSVHVYEVPIPSTFFDSGGYRDVSIALAFDPPTRPRRLDYLGCRMEFHLVRGVAPDLLERLVLKATPDELDEMESEAAENDDELEEDESELQVEGDPDGSGLEPKTLSELGGRLLKLQPAANRRALGANQLGRRRFSKRLNRLDGDRFLLVVRNTNKWMNENDTQNYALAIGLARDEGHEPLYAELEATLRVEVELEIRG